jgi:hypothetical protein
MTDALATRCARAVHVITQEGAVLGAGRASLYVLEVVGWRTLARVLARRPLVWLVELGYRLVARHRGLVGRLLFRPRPTAGGRRGPTRG